MKKKKLCDDCVESCYLEEKQKRTKCKDYLKRIYESDTAQFYADIGC